ncbi:cell shape-determining protein [Sinorhizobium medicae]|uniref:GumC family protein n=1 Tax=Sinorhizobium medicae TaxID=110321 RepID=UPI000FDAA159|nr:GumC family protein [Sinorhizobium medicae]MDX0439961.1 cell shape-determining protein [Sinorhizobium medicae]MDX0490322.1 cell shape-determining protein [Sinorhizobium medicae]MDX0539255.1 cell shape-determining protein [Sinorhizobium medicae]MDX0871704.1 cell shape-determining protein [Sinorhizobium medicae]MDX0952004.1 cell shape-determining protein [Sinorhizobium medicae]
MYRRSEPEGQGLRHGRPSQRLRPTGGSLLDFVPASAEETAPPEEAPTLEKVGASVRVVDLPAPTHNARAPEEPASAADFFPQLHLLGSIGINDIIVWLRDGTRWIVIALLLSGAAAFAYAVTATPRYTVYTDLVVDPSNLNVVSDDVFTTNPQRDAQLLEVESKLRILTSRNVLQRVIDELRLSEDPEFVKPTLLDWLKALLAPRDGKTDKELAAMRVLSERVEARREERSFVVVLKVWSEEPAKAIALSDAIVEAFEAELFQSSAESAGRVAQNLNARLDELRRNVTEAERRVEDFRRQNGLQSTNGELVSNQLSSELNTQVLDGQQRFIQAETRYRQMSSAVAGSRTASASVFESANMTDLRQQYNALQQQIGSMQLTYGERHPRLVAARSERATLETAMRDEARRILERAKADFDRERKALATLRGKADNEKSNVFTDNQAQVQLRDLERDARSKAAIYETHLARAQQITERQQIDTTNVRVISRALPPNARSWPPRTLVLLIGGAFLGLALGIATALALGLWRFLRGKTRAAA